MNIESRITALEVAAAKSAGVDGGAVREEIWRLLTEEPETIEALRTAAMLRDCDLALPSVIDRLARN
ncbi:MAG: hypothetical protein WD851_09365 [Pirellulales bacterium]